MAHAFFDFMAEIKFSCPQCKQGVVCDSSYAGLQINCPACQKPIVVPSARSAAAAPADDYIHIKKSALRSAALTVLVVLLLAAAGWGAYSFLAGAKTITFRAYVDGTDVVKLHGKELWIEHLTWQQPDKISINGKGWKPVWNSDSTPTMPTWNNNRTETYRLSRAFNPGNPRKIQLTKLAGRGEIVIAEKPSSSNNQTLGIRVDDGPAGGADWYEFKVSW